MRTAFTHRATRGPARELARTGMRERSGCGGRGNRDLDQALHARAQGEIKRLNGRIDQLQALGQRASEAAKRAQTASERGCTVSSAARWGRVDAARPLQNCPRGDEAIRCSARLYPAGSLRHAKNITAVSSSATHTTSFARWRIPEGCERSIQNDQLMMVPHASPLPDDAIVVNSTTGMIGMPVETPGGIIVRTLINSKIGVYSQIQVNESDIQRAQLTQENNNAQANARSTGSGRPTERTRCSTSSARAIRAGRNGIRT